MRDLNYTIKNCNVVHNAKNEMSKIIVDITHSTEWMVREF